MKVSESSSKKFLTALLSSVLIALSLAQTCAAQAGVADEPLFASKGGRCGFRDRAGRWVIPPRFRYCNIFEGGMAEVMDESGNSFYVDASGRRVENRNFASNHFSEGLIPVNIGGRYGFADASGHLVVFPSFDDAGDFAEGLAPVKSGGKWGYIDRAGSTLIAPQFDKADSFSEGLASVCFDTGEKSLSEKFTSEIERKCGFIDRTGALVIQPRYDNAGRFAEGLAPVYSGRYYPYAAAAGADAGKWGYVDRAGRLVIPLQYAGASSFSEGLAAVRVGGKSGYIDSSGRFVIRPRFEYAMGFKGGVALVAVGETKYYWPYKGLSVLAIGLKGRHGYIDRTGEFVSSKLTWKGKWKK